MHRFLLNIFCFLALCNNLSGAIIECQRLKEIIPYIEKDTLVVFNINNVLTVAYQDAGSTPWAEERIAQIMKERNIAKPQATNLFIPHWHHILVNTDVELFDPDAEAFVRYLQETGTKVMGLTNRYTEMAYSTHRNLRSVGIDLALAAPFPEDCWIDNIASPAKYIEGIIFNGLINFKGDTLAAFLKQIDCNPKKLIYIEDKPKHLLQVQSCIEDLGIPFLGIHFGALDLQRESYKPELAVIQVKFFEDILDDMSALSISNIPSEIAIRDEIILDGKESGGFPIISSLDKLVSSISENAFFIFDLDHVLLKTSGSIGSRHFYEQCKSKQWLNEDRLIEKIHRRAKVSLIDEQASAFLKNIIDQNCRSIGRTFRPPSLLTRTNSQVQELDLQFNTPFIETSNIHELGILYSRQVTGIIMNLN